MQQELKTPASSPSKQRYVLLSQQDFLPSGLRLSAPALISKGVATVQEEIEDTKEPLSRCAGSDSKKDHFKEALKRAIPVLPSVRLTVQSLLSDPRQISTLTPEGLKMARGFMFPPYKNFQFHMGVMNTLNTDASGNLGSSSSGTIISANGFSSAGEWSAFQALFDEVFVEKILIQYKPYNINCDPISLYKTTTAGRGSVPMGVCSLYNDVPSFTSLGAMLSNPTMQLKHSATSWTYLWKNAVRRIPDAVSTLTTTEVDIKTQGWCPTDSASIARLVGAVQYIGSTTLSSDYFSNTFGAFACQYLVYFRQRN